MGYTACCANLHLFCRYDGYRQQHLCHHVLHDFHGVTASDSQNCLTVLSDLQERVVRAMALAGESALAEETREQFGLSKDTLDIDSAEAAAQRALTVDTYLPLQLSAEAVFLVDDETAISRLVCCLLTSAQLLTALVIHHVDSVHCLTIQTARFYTQQTRD